MKCTFIPATDEDAELLTETAIASKSVWGYPADLLRLWKEELTISASYIRTNIVYKAFAGSEFIGFYAISVDTAVELEHLWLLKEHIGKGYGRLLLQDAKERAGKMGYTSFEVTSDPNANGFYTTLGGIAVRVIRSKVKDRVLQVYRFDL